MLFRLHPVCLPMFSDQNFTAGHSELITAHSSGLSFTVYLIRRAFGQVPIND